MKFLKQSTACTIMFGVFVDKTDGVTLKTDATTITDIDHATTGIFLSKNGGTAAVRHQSVTASVADAYGKMKVTLDATDVNTCGRLDVLFAKAATYLPVEDHYMVLPANVYDALMGTDLLDISLVQVNGSEQTATLDTIKTQLADVHDTDLPAVKTETAAIKTMTDKIGTVTNTGGTATLGAILGDPANSALVTRVAAVKTVVDTIQADTDLLDDAAGGIADIHTDVAAVKTVVDAILVDTGTTLDDLIDTEIASIISELAKVPKSDSNVSWNATALASILTEATTALNTYDPPTKAELDTAQAAVRLANGVHGGAAATLQLKSIAVSNSDAGQPAVKLEATGAGNSHALQLTSTNGCAINALAGSHAVSIVSSAGNGLVIVGATGDIIADITGTLAVCTQNTDMLAASAVKTAMEASGSYLEIIKAFAKHKLTVDDSDGRVILYEAGGAVEKYNVAGGITDDSTTTIRKEMV